MNTKFHKSTTLRRKLKRSQRKLARRAAAVCRPRSGNPMGTSMLDIFPADALGPDGNLPERTLQHGSLTHRKELRFRRAWFEAAHYGDLGEIRASRTC